MWESTGALSPADEHVHKGVGAAVTGWSGRLGGVRRLMGEHEEQGNGSGTDLCVAALWGSASSASSRSWFPFQVLNGRASWPGRPTAGRGGGARGASPCKAHEPADGVGSRGGLVFSAWVRHSGHIYQGRRQTRVSKATTTCNVAVRSRCCPRRCWRAATASAPGAGGGWY